MNKKSIWEKAEGSLEDGAHQKLLEKRDGHSLSLNPREEKVNMGQLPDSHPHTMFQESSL